MHSTLFSEGYLFSGEGPENGLCPPCTPLGSQHLSATLPSLPVSGTGLDNAEQQLGCRSSCPQRCPTADTNPQSREGQTPTAASPRADVLPASVRCLLHTGNRRFKAKICTLYVFIINFLLSGLEVYLAVCFCCKWNPLSFSFSFAIATQDEIFSQAFLKLPLLLAVLACI